MLAISRHVRHRIRGRWLQRHRSFERLQAFMPQHVLTWFFDCLRYRLGPLHKFPTYDDGDNQGVYDVPNDMRVGVAGDWATGTDEAALVAERLKELEPAITLHLGDVYFVGDEADVAETCLGIDNPASLYASCVWPRGSLGSFSLNGNHEMYARGFGYFDTLLPTLGMKGGGGQRASFFCLENDYWRIIAFDTAYTCLGIPILEELPLISDIPGVCGDCHLNAEQLDWLATVVKPSGDRRGLILLSHHQYYSSFDGGYPAPARQLTRFVDRPVIWFWGHEHRFAAYDCFEQGGGIQAHGRCVGHGGMPVELDDKVRDASCPLKACDNRVYPNNEGITVGYNGFADLRFSKQTLTVSYRDLHGTEVVHEAWTVHDGVPQLLTFKRSV